MAVTAIGIAIISFRQVHQAVRVPQLEKVIETGITGNRYNNIQFLAAQVCPLVHR